jgi:hypothetical protein
LDGNDAVGTNAVDSKSFTCPDGTSVRGGAGGRGYDTLTGDHCGLTEPLPGLPDPLGGAKGMSKFDNDITNYPVNCVNGSGGDSAQAAAAGAGADVLGSLSASGWVSQDGDPGLIGPAGGGGGGGGAHARKYGNCYEWASGGGGALGGCGGNGGAPGGGGGASIGLLIVDATVHLIGGHYAAGNGGAGGDGSPGQVGQSGGEGGQGWASGTVPDEAYGCDGGSGGEGGNGGAGGGGAGGLAVSVLWLDREPTVGVDELAPTFNQGAAGAGGDSPGEVSSGGIEGVAADVLEVTGPSFN